MLDTYTMERLEEQKKTLAQINEKLDEILHKLSDYDYDIDEIKNNVYDIKMHQ